MRNNALERGLTAAAERGVGRHDMVGLRRNIVRVVEHQPEWADLFAAESVALRNRIGNILADIQHVGSTAIADLPAKPILDIAVAVRSRDIILLVARRLAETGYVDRGDLGRDGGYLLVKESEPRVRLVHLHVVKQGDGQWQNYIAFRDALRRDSKLRQQYASLKRHVAEQFPDDRKSYTEAKKRFIQAVLKSEARQSSAAEARRRAADL